MMCCSSKWDSARKNGHLCSIAAHLAFLRGKNGAFLKALHGAHPPLCVPTGSVLFLKIES